MRPRYAIGIDLGTTHCVLAYVDLREARGRPEVLPIPQLQTHNTIVTEPLLPSFFYFATDAELEHDYLGPLTVAPGGEHPGFAVGAFARAQMNVLPGRVIDSAKSWLAHGGVDREAPILPFGSDEISPSLRLSPVEASAAYLEYLKEAWDHVVARTDDGQVFAAQRVVVTVPASFDEGAQALTRKAAALAGYPPDLRLLEEPQAAFYAWLAESARHDNGARLLECLPHLAGGAQIVLVCDIGGGTSDFSLFRIAPARSAEELPDIERIAAGDHLLLGGDNIDLALAHLLERRLKPGTDERLSRRQWSHLVPQARRLKEEILGREADAEELYHVSVPGEGGSLFQAAMSTAVSLRDVQGLILDGFFPMTAADDLPHRRQAGLREIGLPYASDTAVSRHLAAFLRGRPVDAVLFAGGTLQPRFLRERLLELIESWQGRRPATLALGQMDLAIAQGAAHFGALLGHDRERIHGGYARSVYLELREDDPEKTPKVVCVLPQGFEEGSSLKIDAPAFDLLVNQPVRFTAYTSNRRDEDKPGAIVDLDREVFHPLPPLVTTLVLEEGELSLRKAADLHISVFIEAELTELGVLQLYLVGAEQRGRWRLEFNLRKSAAVAASGPATKAEDPGVSSQALQAALARIELFYGKKQALDPDHNVKTLVRDLEKTLGRGRDTWNLALLRSLWSAVHPGITRRGRSVAHENAWLYLAGFVLRPGYGADVDPWRMTQLWECASLGMAHKKEKSVQANWWMMWRRTAGGLSPEQQERLFREALPQAVRAPVEFVEGVRLLGALERVPVASKSELAELIFDLILKGKAANQSHLFWTLARLLGRVPLYASADSVVAAELVERCFARVEPLDWKAHGLLPLASVFSAACRYTDVRSLDIHDAWRGRVINKLRRAGAKPEQIRIVQEHCEVSAAERNYLFGEALPVGLRQRD